jgi:prepilin-type N-terminal cleavage/methylation domain-containing protein
MKQRVAQRVALPGMPAGGFTLIEVILVVVIIGIAAGVVVPMMSSAGSMQIRAAANLIAADIEYAKSMAISRGQPYSVVFNKTTETYQVVDKDNKVILHPVKKGFNYVIDFRNDGRLDRVDILDVSFDGTNKVTFDYLGSPYNGGSPATPLNSGVVTLRSGTITRTVSVEPVTGFISVSN